MQVRAKPKLFLGYAAAGPELADNFAEDELGLTQVEVNEQLGLPQSVISRLEEGQRKVSAIEARDLSELFGVSMEWLVPGPSSGRRRR